jgi:hypothetical protein
MPSESGDLKLLANFRKLIDLVSADANYNPSNTALVPLALNAQHASGLTAAHDVPAKLTLNMAAISDREAAFDGLSPRITRVHGLAKASGASKPQLEDLDTFRRKLISKRKAKPKVVTAATGDASASEPEAEKTHSSAQGSYDNQVGHVRGYLSALSALSSYNPNEADLKLPALNGFADDLQAKNDAVSSTFAISEISCSIKPTTQS